jgi:hypothetical protein
MSPLYRQPPFIFPHTFSLPNFLVIPEKTGQCVNACRHAGIQATTHSSALAIDLNPIPRYNILIHIPSWITQCLFSLKNKNSNDYL